MSDLKGRRATEQPIRQAGPIPGARLLRTGAAAGEIGVVGLLAAAFVVAVRDSSGRAQVEPLFATICAAVVVLIYVLAESRSDRSTSSLAALPKAALAWTLAAVTGAVLLAAASGGAVAQPAFVAGSYAAGLAAVVAYRATVTGTIGGRGDSNRLHEALAVIAFDQPDRATLWLRRVEERGRSQGVYVSAFCVPGRTVAVGGIASAASVADLAELLAQRPVDRVLVVAPGMTGAELTANLHALRRIAVDVDVVANGYDDVFTDRPLGTLVGIPTVRLLRRPLSAQQATVKRLEDLAVSAVALLLLAPLMGLIAVAVRAETPGPVLFRQHRRGVNGQPFQIWKFRTMHAQASAGGEEVKQAVRGDPRVTRVGRWLRRTSLDELPQVFNVLHGEMSIVGPRPHAIQHDEWYGSRIPAYIERHRMKPGITGWAQVNGLRGETETLAKMRTRVAHDIWYMTHWSLALDLWILIRTVFVLGHRNAY
ncbi:exopolysaccharide biosynthesis polyprenyl glycosylphosphotransferase [Limimonas halophila]|uniref:exopolysaccharide biosynthesis polyprenyl glycosylphosphotransferase n=1 Tax=Limimonas halophila TaxID=1082479 RepID=UPI0015A046A1|nr:exopolysaccharide biosynthesis polyprenyl glycosylphosphotransferase [Limimonas halophila]